MGYIIAVDQGTTSTRSIVFDDQFAIVGQGQEEFEQHFPNSGWVEHNPKDLLATVIATCKKALNDGKIRAFLPQSGKLLYAINDAHNHGVTAINGTNDC